MKLATVTIFATLTLASPALAAYTQVSDVISGGGMEVSNGTYTLNGTIGQSSAIGLSSGTTYDNHGGFWNLRTGDTVAPAALIFILPATNKTLTIPITTLTAEDAHGITGYYISELPVPPDPWGPGWVPANPGTVVSLGTGPRTFYVWAKDAAGNLSNGASAGSDIISHFLNVAFGGSGGTSITSNPEGIACMTGNTGSCKVLFDVNSLVQLSTTSAWTATLTNWAGTDSTGSPGNVTMSADKDVTATFGTAMNARNQLAPMIPYGMISDAYTAASLGATIEARNILFTESLLIARAGVIYNLNGGYVGTGFGQPGASDFTSIKGSLTIKSGRLNVKRIKVHQ